MHSIKQYADPRHRAGFFVGPHVLILAAIVVLVAFFAGFWSGQRYEASYFQQHYQVPLQPPRVHALAPDLYTNLPPQASIDIARYPGVGNQGTLGSCAAWSSAWALSYEYRMLHPASWLRFSPRWLYDYYSDTYAGGADAGSWPDRDLEIVPQQGVPRFKAFPYPLYQIDNPFPADTYGAAAFRTPVTVTTLIEQQGGGAGVFDAIRSVIASGHPALLGTEVPYAFDNATSTNGLIDEGPGDPSRGGHAIVGIAYTDAMAFPDGSLQPAVEIRNQWSRAWGRNGDAWLSLRFVEGYVWAVQRINYGASAPKAGPTHKYIPSQGPTYRIAPPGASVTPPPAAPRAWYVRGVKLRDTGKDISDALNLWGSRYSVWPAGLAAVAATESGFRATADRYGTWPDVSFGLMQFTVATAESYGVCHDTASCKAWLDDSDHSIQLAAEYLATAQKVTCEPWAWLYVAYNVGPGYGCGAYFYTHPTGQAAVNLNQNFIPNYRYVLATYSATTLPYHPPASLFGLTNVTGFVPSIYWNESALLDGSLPVADDDYMLPQFAQEQVSLPGTRYDPYWYAGRTDIGGSGIVAKFRTINKGRFAFLHLSRLFSFPLWKKLYGGAVIGFSGWPTDPLYGNGTSGGADAHLCLALDALANVWMERVETHHDIQKPPRKPFPLVLWHHWTAPHHKPPIPYRAHGHLKRMAWAWAYDRGASKKCGPPKSGEVWWARRGFMRQTYVRCVEYGWPRKRGFPVKFS